MALKTDACRQTQIATVFFILCLDLSRAIPLTPLNLSEFAISKSKALIYVANK